MPKINPISGKKLVKILSTIGFCVVRTKGSHHFLYNNDGRCTTVPVHNNEDISVGLLKKILEDINFSTEDYDNLLKNL